MVMTEEDESRFQKDTTCHICNLPIRTNQVKVRDHCHLTGKYRAAAHESCNINFKLTRTIPVIFHNLSSYDAHFLIEDISNAFDGDLNVIPITTEKYISFTKKVKGTKIKLCFIDLLRFLNCSLEKLASYLNNEDKIILKSEFPNLTEFNLLNQKGIFPYDYITEMSVLDEKSLPPHEKFYNKMNDENVSVDNYNHAMNVWNSFNCQTIGDYSDLYLKSDVILLADIFENFRNTLMKTHDLDPAHYFTLPGYTWDCSLKYTGIELQLLTDIDMVMFIERGIRGGLSQCSNRYSCANNKYMKNYDPTKPSKYILYLDINNMYGWAMCQPLPYGGFEWVKDCENFNFDNIPDDSEYGYIQEIETNFSNDLHDLQKDLPMMPKKVLSPGSKHKNNATLYDKNRYSL